MSRPRRHLFIVLGLLGCVATAAGVWLFWPRTAITPENAARIQKGMTLEQVEAILGGPPRDEMTGPAAMQPDWNALKRAFEDSDSKPVRIWGSDRVRVFVRFTVDGHVAEVVTAPVRRIVP